MSRRKVIWLLALLLGVVGCWIAIVSQFRYSFETKIIYVLVSIVIFGLIGMVLLAMLSESWRDAMDEEPNLIKYRCRSGYCFKCGYDLTGNQSGKCPECGCRIERS